MMMIRMQMINSAILHITDDNVGDITIAPAKYTKDVQHITPINITPACTTDDNKTNNQ